MSDMVELLLVQSGWFCNEIGFVWVKAKQLIYEDFEYGKGVHAVSYKLVLVGIDHLLIIYFFNFGY